MSELLHDEVDTCSHNLLPTFSRRCEYIRTEQEMQLLVL